MQVTTMRSKGSLKPLIPCMNDPVNKLEGLGEKTRRNLQDVRACAASLEMADAVPEDCRNTVTTGWTSPYPHHIADIVLWFKHSLSICAVSSF